MKKTNNKSKSSKNKKSLTAPQMQLSNNVSLYNKRTSAFANISYPVFIYAYSGTDLYSFNSGSDIRNLSFTTILTSSEYTNFGSVFNNYRVKSLSAIVNPVVNKVATTAYPLLQINCDPETSSVTNPTNSSFVLRDTNHLFTPYSIVPKSITFTFPGVGVTTNIWKSVTDAPLGGIFIGNNSSTGLFGSTSITFEIILTLLIEFNNVK